MARTGTTTLDTPWVQPELTSGRPRLPLSMAPPTGLLDDPEAQVPVVYFAARNGLVKIGTTKRYRKRITELAAYVGPDNRGGPVVVLLTIAGSFDLERTLHQLFADDHVGNEWYRPSQQLVEYIARFRLAHERFGLHPVGLGA